MVPNQGPLVAWTAGFVGPKEDDNTPPEVRVYSEWSRGQAASPLAEA